MKTIWFGCVLLALACVSCSHQDWHVSVVDLNDAGQTGMYDCCLKVDSALTVEMVSLMLLDENRIKVGELMLLESQSNDATSFAFRLCRNFLENSIIAFDTMEPAGEGGSISVFLGEHLTSPNHATDHSRMKMPAPTVPDITTVADAPWHMAIVHPSMHDDELYGCTLSAPMALGVDDVTILLNDRDGIVGSADLSSLQDPLKGDAVYHFYLDYELIKNSVVTFRVTSKDSEYAGQKFAVRLGLQKTIRRENGTIVHEAIE